MPEAATSTPHPHTRRGDRSAGSLTSFGGGRLARRAAAHEIGSGARWRQYRQTPVGVSQSVPESVGVCRRQVLQDI